MERHDVLEMMTALKLAGMRAAYDDILADGLKRRHPVQQIIGTLLQVEIADKQARSIKYQMASARLPTAKELADFDFAASPVNEPLIQELAGGGFLEGNRARRPSPCFTQTLRCASGPSRSVWRQCATVSLAAGVPRYDIETVEQYRKWDAGIAATDTGNAAGRLCQPVPRTVVSPRCRSAAIGFGLADTCPDLAKSPECPSRGGWQPRNRHPWLALRASGNERCKKWLSMKPDSPKVW